MKIDISRYDLLQHPFYRAWEDGSLSPAALRRYAKAYFAQVAAFPRYLSAVHSQVEDIGTRQMLLENLNDEERGPENHPELWLRFCDSLGLAREEVQGEAPEACALRLTERFHALCRQSAASGLGALYAYESQVPRVAEFKSRALQKFYLDADDLEGVKFFEVHRQADVWHTQALEKALAELGPEERVIARESAERAAAELWGFLDGMAA